MQCNTFCKGVAQEVEVQLLNRDNVNIPQGSQAQLPSLADNLNTFKSHFDLQALHENNLFVNS